LLTGSESQSGSDISASSFLSSLTVLCRQHIPKLEKSTVNLRRIIVLTAFFPLSAGFLVAQATSAAAPSGANAASGSPSARIGLFVNPKNNQDTQQPAQDENACYATAQQQTGIDPSAPANSSPEAAKKQGGGAKGAAGGAAGGAAVGAIAGDAGTGAAIGATAGAVRGRRQQKKANQQAEQQAQQQGQAQQQQRIDTFRRAFSSCIDAKGYSVK
jgi:hypothetical protein